MPKNTQQIKVLPEYFFFNFRFNQKSKLFLIQFIALLPIVLSLVTLVLFFILFNNMHRTSVERNDILKNILSELRSRRE